MIEEIRIYIEGGGDSAHGKSRLRQGFNAFFKNLRDVAGNRRIRWATVASGSRNSCFDDFCRALRSHPGAFNVLLVDAECAVTSDPCQHLRSRERWTISAEQRQCQLMVQAMEAWLVADRAALARYYGSGFLDSSVPRNTDVEEIEKTVLESALDRATHDTQKGRYRKIRHGADLLALVDLNIVRQKAAHCDRLFQTLESIMGLPGPAQRDRSVERWQ